MMAIQEVAETLIMNQTKNNEISIHSDSQAALKSLNKRKISNSTTLDTMKTLNKLSNKNSVTISWIPGHEGYEGNELADGRIKHN